MSVITHGTDHPFLCFIAFYGVAVFLVYSERQHCQLSGRALPYYLQLNKAKSGRKIIKACLAFFSSVRHMEWVSGVTSVG